MSDTPSNPVPPAPPTPPAPPAPTPAAGGPTDEGKLFAILSYALNFIGLPFWIVPVIQRNNEFALYHAKQAGAIWVIAFANAIIGGMIALGAYAALYVLGCVVHLGVMAVGLGMLVLNILGLINAVNSKMVPLPVIGETALNMLKGMTVKSGS